MSCLPASRPPSAPTAGRACSASRSSRRRAATTEAPPPPRRHEHRAEDRWTVSTDLGRLGLILQRELDAGAEDTLVQGGLDELLRSQARDEPPGSALLRMVAHLPAAGYRSLDEDDRRTWLRRALATVHREAGLERDTRAPRGHRDSERGRRSNGAGQRPAPSSAATQRPARAAARDARPPPKPAIPPGAAGLDAPIAAAGTGLRSATLKRVQSLGVQTIGDALRYYPYRHHDFTQTVPIAALRFGVDQTVRGVVESSRDLRFGRGRGGRGAAEVVLRDAAGSSIQAIWFNQPFIARSIRVGSEIALAGKVGQYRNRPAFQNPEYETLTEEMKHTGRLVPVYHLTQGLAQRPLRTAIATLVERYAERIEDPLPEEIRERHGLLELAEATRQVHYPDSQEALEAARRRLAFDELLAVQIGVQTRKREWQDVGNAPMVGDHSVADAFLAGLPFALTDAQQRALHDLRGDLARSAPMSRLLEGDVGSGKTVVALAAMLSVVAAGYQAVLMAPTEVLAEQHYRTLCRVLSGEPEPPLTGVIHLPGLELRIVLLTGSTRSKERRAALETMRHGEAVIAVGTHALIQGGVEYRRLGLAVVDEQHRFGVMQRSELRRKGAEAAKQAAEEGSDAAETVTPHLLVMSATPIPRSLALTAYGDLDLSVIDEMPPGRTPIETKWLPPIQRREAFLHVRREIEAGRQAFVICPLVEGSESVASRAATEEYERLRREEFPDLADRITLLHGRMASKEKDAIMRAFAAGDTDILVSTSVVEVGIDVPNATVMVIEGADRFGLAQLHQFRGRVGRGEHPSYCYLLADDPSAEAEERLSVMERTTDGFALAQADLELRGPGDLFGTQQSGLPSLRIANLLDAQLIDATRREAERLLEDDPRLAKPEHQALRYAIAERLSEVVAEHH
ncbi:MAG: ATP-dependent DNA helicase RecG [Dehalococcoidia bacterium]|nr:ATP-dependent DNA helicase RecG [Dehalococcoidia bacterium]